MKRQELQQALRAIRETPSAYGITDEATLEALKLCKLNAKNVTLELFYQHLLKFMGGCSLSQYGEGAHVQSTDELQQPQPSTQYTETETETDSETQTETIETKKFTDWVKEIICMAVVGWIWAITLTANELVRVWKRYRVGEEIAALLQGVKDWGRTPEGEYVLVAVGIVPAYLFLIT